MRFFSILALSLVLVGCVGRTVTHWDKEGITEQQFNMDLNQCIYEAESNTSTGTLSPVAREARVRELRDLCLIARGYVQKSREFVMD